MVHWWFVSWNECVRNGIVQLELLLFIYETFTFINANSRNYAAIKYTFIITSMKRTFNNAICVYITLSSING